MITNTIYNFRFLTFKFFFLIMSITKKIKHCGKCQTCHLPPTSKKCKGCQIDYESLMNLTEDLDPSMSESDPACSIDVTVNNEETLSSSYMSVRLNKQKPCLSHYQFLWHSCMLLNNKMLFPERKSQFVRSQALTALRYLAQIQMTKEKCRSTPGKRKNGVRRNCSTNQSS